MIWSAVRRRSDDLSGLRGLIYCRKHYALHRLLRLALGFFLNMAQSFAGDGLVGLAQVERGRLSCRDVRVCFDDFSGAA
jgi:hypothetical protein